MEAGRKPSCASCLPFDPGQAPCLFWASAPHLGEDKWMLTAVHLSIRHVAHIAGDHRGPFGHQLPGQGREGTPAFPSPREARPGPGPAAKGKRRQ